MDDEVRDEDAESDSEVAASYRKILYVLSAGFACFYGASISLIGLQTSIGVMHSIGPTSVVVGYVSSIISSLLLAPFLLKHFGPKTTLITGEMLWPLFTLANFYTGWLTMIPGAIMFGIAVPLAMAASGVIASSLGRRKGAETRVTAENQSNFGTFFVFVCCGQILSNGLAGVVLKGMEDHGNTNQAFSFKPLNFTAQHLLHCGIQDCPADYAYGKEYHHKHFKLVPNKPSIYAVLSIYLVIHTVAVLIHCIGLPAHWSTEAASVAVASPSDPILAERKSSYVANLIATFREMKRHLSSLQGLLILPVTLYLGLFESFIWSEFNRAFVSCTIGVQMVGFTTALLDSVSLLTSLVISKASGRLGIISIASACFVMDLANYISLLIWVPTADTLFVPFILASAFGIAHGLRRNATYIITSTNFVDVEIAFSLQLTTESIGIALGYAWSTPLCVHSKLYIMLTALCISTLSFSIAHFRFYKFGKTPF